MPTDSCNMKCKYCFHECFNTSSERMTLETVDRLLEVVCNSCSSVQFVWHGGEPLLMGYDFYRYVFEKQKMYPRTKTRNSMQSNLTLLTDKMADLLCDNSVGVGTSFDGILNEELRGNSYAILEGRRKILQRGHSCGVIMVVSNQNINTLLDSYELFKKMNINYGMNTYVSRGAEYDRPFDLDVENAIMKFKDFFDIWIDDKDCSIHVDYYERILQYISSGKKTVCKNTSCIGRWMGVRYDGKIVPCNRCFPNEYSYGNIWDYNSIFEAFDSPGAIKLIGEAIERRKKCLSCEAYGLCEGGCNNVAYNEGGIKSNGGNTCVIFREIYRYINEHVKKNGYLGIRNPVARKIFRKRDKHFGNL